MTNYLNQIESDLYKLNSITNGSGEVVEMVADLKEKYQKAEAFDRIVQERNRIGKLMHNKEYPKDFTDEAFWNIDDIIIDTESGEPNGLREQRIYPSVF